MNRSISHRIILPNRFPLILPIYESEVDTVVDFLSDHRSVARALARVEMEERGDVSRVQKNLTAVSLEQHQHAASSSADVPFTCNESLLVDGFTIKGDKQSRSACVHAVTLTCILP